MSTANNSSAAILAGSLSENSEESFLKNSKPKKTYSVSARRSDYKKGVQKNITPRFDDIPQFDIEIKPEASNQEADSTSIQDNEFISINDLLSSENIKKSDFSLRIKHASMSPIIEDTKRLNRTKGYFEYLQECGVFKNAELGSTHFCHQIKDQPSSLIGVNFAGLKSKSFFVNICTTEKKFQKAFNENIHQQGSHLAINSFTGMCLFGSGVDEAILDNGKTVPVVEIGDSLGEIPENKIVDINIKADFSLYEVEKLNRMECFLNSFHDSCQNYNNAFLITPRVQYYLYLMPAYEAGKITKEAYLKWIKLVRAREDRNYKDLKNRLELPLHLCNSSLAESEEYIISQIKNGQKVCFDTVVKKLIDEGQGWKKVVEQEMPGNWAELRLLSYVITFLNHVESSAEQGVMTVAIDDLCEKVILNQYARLKKKLKNAGHEAYAALGFYMPQNIFRVDLESDSALYGPQEYNFTQMKNLIENEYETTALKAREGTFFEEIKFVIGKYQGSLSEKQQYAIKEIEAVLNEYQSNLNKEKVTS